MSRQAMLPGIYPESPEILGVSGLFLPRNSVSGGFYASLRASSRQGESAQHARVLPENIEIVEVLLGASANSRRISAG